MPIRFRPPRDVPDLGLTRGQQERFNAWLRTAFTEIAEDMATLGQSDAPTIVAQETIDVAAGSMRRVTPPVGGMAVRVPAPTPANAGQTVRLMIEAPVGDLTVVSVPGVGDDGKVFQPTINGEARATFSTSGLVTLTSNGSSDWKSASEFAAESPASVAISSGGGALDAQYLLRTANASLPNARVADDSTEIDISYSSPGLVSWFLKTASVAFSKLADLAGLSVLGRAANSSGVMAAITSTAARQVLRNNDAGTSLHWEYPVGIGSDAAGWVFDGVDDNIDGGDILEFERTDPFTVSIWFATTSASAQMMIDNAQDDATARGLRVFIDNSPAGVIGWTLANNNNGSSNTLAINSTGTFNDGSLHNLLVSYNGSSSPAGVVFYIDGAPVSMSTVASTLSATTIGTSVLTVGRTASALPFSGTLQHFAEWDSALTATHASEVYNGGVPPDLMSLATAPDPVIWWKIDGSDATGAGGVVDHSASGFDGTAGGGLGAAATVAQAHSIEFTDGLDSSVSLGQATVSVDISDVIDNVSITDDGANNAQRAALTGFAAAAAGSNATTSAEPIVTYSASANMSAERVLTTSTSNTVSTAVAGQIQVQSVAKTGAISQAANANATLFAGIRDNGSAENDRTNLNFVSSTSATAVVTDDSGNDELEITFQRAALTGAVSASANANATLFAGIRDNGTLETARGFINVLSTSTITALGTQDAGNDEIELTWSVNLAATYAWTGGHSWNTSGDFDVTAALVSLLSSSTLSLDSVGDMTLQSDADLILTGDEVRVRNNGTGGFLTFDGATASTPGLAAGEGMYWVEDPGAAATIPRFTDDANVDWKLLAFGQPGDSALPSVGFTGTPFVVYRDVAASGSAVARDTALFNGNVPFALNVIQCGVRVNPGVGGSTMTFRDTVGGGGNALSSALSTATTGTVQISANYTGVVQVAAGGSITCRWSDGTTGGRVWALCVRD